MPNAPPRVCSKAGCFKLTTTGRCEAHPFKPRVRTTYDKTYDARRGTAASRGYDARWRKLRDRKLQRNPLCEHCLKRGAVQSATEVDHIIPITQDATKRLDWDNLQSLCHPCHMRKTAQDGTVL